MQAPHHPATPPAPRPWRPVPLLWGSVALHVGCAAVWLAQPALWPWCLAALAANHGLLTTLVLLPRNAWLGANITRLPAAAAHQGLVALTFDDGPDPLVTPQVLDLLDAYGAKASFFCIGKAVSQYPEWAQTIAARGHSVENHGFAHSPFLAFWGSRRAQRDLMQQQRAIHACTGLWPQFFRPTAGFRNPMLDHALARTGLRLVMWTRRGFDTRCRDADTVLQRLTHNLAAGDILLLHDGHAARTAQGQPLVLAVLPRLLHILQQHNLQAVDLRRGLHALPAAQSATHPMQPLPSKP